MGRRERRDILTLGAEGMKLSIATKSHQFQENSLLRIETGGAALVRSVERNTPLCGGKPYGLFLCSLKVTVSVKRPLSSEIKSAA